MLGLIRRHRRRVSNGLAIFGALLLTASLLAGTGQPPRSADRQADARMQSGETQTGSAEPVQRNVSTKTRKFRASLFLFRN